MDPETKALIAVGVVELILAPIVVFVVKRQMAKKLDEFDRKRDEARAERKERHDRETAWQDSVTAGLRSLLRSELVSEHRKASDAGWYDLQSREYLARVRSAYHALGGNDIGDQLYNETVNLPTHQPHEKHCN